MAGVTVAEQINHVGFRQLLFGVSECFRYHNILTTRAGTASITFAGNRSHAMDKLIPDNILPYPLPPWEHDYRVLAVFGEVEEARLQPLVPPPLKL